MWKKTIEPNVQLERKIKLNIIIIIEDIHLPRLVRVSQTTLIFAAANKRECSVKQAICKKFHSRFSFFFIIRMNFEILQLFPDLYLLMRELNLDKVFSNWQWKSLHSEHNLINHSMHEDEP